MTGMSGGELALSAGRLVGARVGEAVAGRKAEEVLEGLKSTSEFVGRFGGHAFHGSRVAGASGGGALLGRSQGEASVVGKGWLPLQRYFPFPGELDRESDAVDGSVFLSSFARGPWSGCERDLKSLLECTKSIKQRRLLVASAG